MLWWVHPDGTGLHKLGEKTVIEPFSTQYGPPVRSYLGSSFSPSFSEGEGWITTSLFPSLTGGPYAEVARMRIEDGHVVRTTNLTKSAMNVSPPDWGTHQPGFARGVL